MSTSDGMKADILGLFFGQYNTAPGEATPSTDLTIKKDDLMASDREIVGRYAWQNDTSNTVALVCQVSIDGVPVTDMGGANVKATGRAGTVDEVVFKYPNTAKALALGKHFVSITPGVHNGVLGGQHTYGIGFPTTTWFPAKSFSITLV